ncbi:MAG: hypothetical protein U0931_20055 [Vulcanimicrobiota bacterium]
MEFDPGVRYECLQCGKSCRKDWDVWVRPELPAKIGRHYREIFESVGERWRMRRNAGGCLCLDGQSRCQIHSALSYDDKPYRCQQYPILLTRTPDGIRVSASYTCTAVLQQAGPELARLEEQVENWVEGPFFVTEVGYDVPWAESVALDEHFLELLAQTDWESALRRILSGLASGHVDGLTSHPVSWWKSYRSLPVDLTTCLPWLLAATLKPCLQLADRESWQQFDEAFIEGGRVSVQEIGYLGDRSQILAWALDVQPDTDLERYRASLFFRKQHLRCGGVLSGWFQLWSIGPVYRVLRQWLGSHTALERIEMNLLEHTDLGHRVLPSLAGEWLSRQGTGRQELPGS